MPPVEIVSTLTFQANPFHGCWNNAKRVSRVSVEVQTDAAP
jgi:hypothetical protein